MSFPSNIRVRVISLYAASRFRGWKAVPLRDDWGGAARLAGSGLKTVISGFDFCVVGFHTGP